MRVHSRLLIAAAALLLGLVYFFPIWTIELRAPMYRDGIGMHIFVNDVRGHDEHDIQNINILNHYIGMRPIVPEEFGEFEIMPFLLGLVILLALLAASVGKLWLVGLWGVVFGVLGIAGLVDFNFWLYDFGHNLSPDAPIKVPGMTYQPPLFGKNQVVNIVATSYPHVGTVLLLGAALLGLIAFLSEWHSRREALQA
jgi:copper chaperone NosL